MEKYTLGQRAADAIAKFAGKLGVYFLVYRRPGVVDDRQHGAGSARRLTRIRFILLNLVLSCVRGHPGAADHDEPEPAGGKGPPPGGKRLQGQPQDGDHDRGHLHDKVNAILAKQSAAGKAAAKAERREKQIRFRHKFLMEHFKGSTADSIARCCLKSVIGATAPASAELVTYKHKTRQTLRPLSVSLRELLPFPIPEPRPQR